MNPSNHVCLLKDLTHTHFEITWLLQVEEPTGERRWIGRITLKHIYKNIFSGMKTGLQNTK
jgi:hypothetical protein